MLIIFVVMVLGVFSYFYFRNNVNSNKITKNTEIEKNKGEKFEEEVVEFLNTIPEVKVLKNVIIPNNAGGTTELDIVVLSKKGFYILECKNYSGVVKGDANEKEWNVRYSFNGFKKDVKFYNPLKQNAGHVKSLRKFFPKFYFQPITIFNDTTVVEKSLLKRNDVNLFKGYKKFMTEFFAQKKDEETQAVVDSLYNYLKDYENLNKEKHIEYVSSFK